MRRNSFIKLKADSTTTPVVSPDEDKEDEALFKLMATVLPDDQTLTALLLNKRSIFKLAEYVAAVFQKINAIIIDTSKSSTETTQSIKSLISTVDTFVSDLLKKFSKQQLSSKNTNEQEKDAFSKLYVNLALLGCHKTFATYCKSFDLSASELDTITKFPIVNNKTVPTELAKILSDERSKIIKSLSPVFKAIAAKGPALESLNAVFAPSPLQPSSTAAAKEKPRTSSVDETGDAPRLSRTGSVFIRVPPAAPVTGSTTNVLPQGTGSPSKGDPTPNMSNGNAARKK